MGGEEAGEVAVAVVGGEVSFVGAVVVDPEEGGVAVAEVEAVVVVEPPGVSALKGVGVVEFAKAAPAGVEVTGGLHRRGGGGLIEEEAQDPPGVGVVGEFDALVGEAGAEGGGEGLDAGEAVLGVPGILVDAIGGEVAVEVVRRGGGGGRHEEVAGLAGAVPVTSAKPGAWTEVSWLRGFEL